MVDTQLKDHSLKVFPEGLLGKHIELRFVEARRARKTAVHAVQNKNEIIKAAKIIPQKVKEHKINEVDEWTVKYIDMTSDLFQQTYFGIFDELLPLKQDLELVPKFLEKHYNEFSLDEIHQYEKYLLELRAMLEVFRKYLDELDSAIKGREMAEGSLNIKLIKYNISSVFHPLRNALEWWHMRSEAKGTFKEEKKIEDIQNKKQLTKADIKHLLQHEKAYVNYTVDVLTNLCVYTLIGIRNAYAVGSDVIEATSPKRFDLPQSFRAKGEELLNILNKEYDALRSLNKSRLQLNDLLINAKNAVEKAKKQIEERERTLKRVA